MLLAALVALNGGLATLFLRLRPRRAVNLALAAVVAGNAALTLTTLLARAGAPWLVQVAESFDALTIVALLVIPLVFPRRRLSPRGERFALAAGAAFVILYVVSRWDPDASGDLLLRPTMSGVLPLIGFAAAIVLLTDDLVRLPEGPLRVSTALIAAAFSLKAGALLGTQLDPAMWSLDDLHGAIFGRVPFALLAIGALTLPASLALRAARRGSAPTRTDALALAALPVGILFGLAPNADGPTFTWSNIFQAEHLLARPLLLGVGILSVQLLRADVRRDRAAFVVVALSAAVATLVYAQMNLAAAGFEDGVAAGLATILALALVAPFAVTLFRAAAADGATRDPRAAIVYRSAIESARASAPGHGAADARILAELRARAGLAPGEDALDAGPEEGALLSGRYRVRALLGEGGFGRAFAARDERLGRDVVLKILRMDSHESRARAEREARTLARVSHPHVVAIHDVIVVGGETVLVLEHLPGGSLATRLGAGPLPLRSALAIADQVLAGLEAAHAAGIVHRDVKPENVLFDAAERAKLVDFGIARVERGDRTATGLSLGGAPGSVRFASPEQARGGEVDARSDLFSAGAVLYRALAGRDHIDFTGRTEFEARLAIVEEPSAFPIDGAPAALDALLRELLEKDRSARPASASAVRARLRPLLDRA